MFAMVIRYAAALMTLAGIAALASGLYFWLSGSVSLLSMHMLLGLLTVGGLWTIGIAQAIAAGGSWLLAAVAFMVGALTIYLGINQAAMVPGELHWLIQTSHLVLGVLSIGIGHMAAARQRRAANQTREVGLHG